MDLWPVESKRRKRWERVIWIIDLCSYAGVVLGGVYALVFTPTSVVDELRGWEWLIYLWGALLFVGGGVGFVARFVRRWFYENPATVLAFFGVIIYFLILSKTAFDSVTAAVASILVLLSGLGMLRRYAELQIYGTEPGQHSFAYRMAAAWERKTSDVVHHQ